MTAHGFSTGEYRILAIEVEGGQGQSTRLYRLNDPVRREPVELRFGEPFRLRVQYECMLPQVPDVSCGVAAAFTRADTMEHACYFNTNYPHSDEELQHYDQAEFRKYRGRSGVVEGTIQNLQMRPGDYLLTVGILPNAPSPHEFYELHYLQYRLSVSGVDFPGAFYGNVKFEHTLHADLEPEWVHEGTQFLRSRGVNDAETVMRELYAIMTRRS